MVYECEIVMWAPEELLMVVLLTRGGAVDRGVVLWIEEWCCGSRSGAVDRGVVLTHVHSLLIAYPCT
jgi:hypothetical protein